jgi:hypothetical protein
MATENKVELVESDYKTKVPYGFKGEKITIAEMVETAEFKSLEPIFASRILNMIREKPTFGILKGGADRSDEQVRNLFYNNYKKIPGDVEYENDSSKYEEIKSGKIKWNPEDKQWYSRKPGKQTVAVPGASWHTGGYAVDFTGNVNDAAKIAKKYQVEQILGTGETHHFQPLGVPASKRMFLELKDTYGIDSIKNPLSPDILLYINKEIASNVPRHPQRIKKVLDAAIDKFKLETGLDDRTAAFDVATWFGQQQSGTKISWGEVASATPTTVAKALKVDPPKAIDAFRNNPPGFDPRPVEGRPTVGSPATTTTTTVPPTTTTTRTVRPTTTTTQPPAPPSTLGNVGRIPGVGESPVTTTTGAPTTTTMPPTTTTEPMATTSSTMQPTTTTVKPMATTTTTAPGGETQPTIPPAGQYGSTSTTLPPNNPNPTPGAGGSRVSPDISNQGVLFEEGAEKYQSAIGVKGRRYLDANGNVIKYEGYKYSLPARYGTTSGAGGATGSQMIPGRGGQAVEPKYFSGDEDQIFGFSIEEISNLQRAMNGIGILGNKYAPGVADSRTRAAFANLLGQANGYGEDYSAAIIRMASVGGSGGGSGNLVQYRVSSEADIKNIISKVAKRDLGRNLGEGDLTRLAAMYRQMEKESGLAAGSNTQQEVVAAPSPEAFAESQLGKMLPDETNARQFGSYLEAIKEKYQI